MNEATQKSTGGEDHRAGRNVSAILKPNTGRTPRLDQKIVGFRLDYFQVWNGANRSLHCPRIELSVNLRARATHGGAFSAVKKAELDAAKIADSAHKAIESVDFANEMAFPKPANGGIAGHCTNGAESVRNKRRFGAHTGRCGSSLTAGMPATNHYDVESVRHHALGWGVLTKAPQRVKTIGFIENVSRETLGSRQTGIPQALWKTPSVHLFAKDTGSWWVTGIIHTVIFRCRIRGRSHPGRRQRRRDP
jgi:hypothetical protein